MTDETAGHTGGVGTRSYSRDLARRRPMTRMTLRKRGIRAPRTPKKPAISGRLLTPCWLGSLSLSLPFPAVPVRDGEVETRAEDASPSRRGLAPALLTFAYRRGLARERALPPGCCSLNAGDGVDRRRWQGDDAARASWYRRLAVLKTRAPESHDSPQIGRAHV